MKMHHFSLFAAMVLTIAVTGLPAMAQTPDGSTPAVEGICDTLKADGISKGLYGLCVAYCEAQDFSSEDEPLTEADILALLEANAPSGRILENYNKRRTVDDPEMPCVVPKVDSCPCFTQAETDRIDGYHDVSFVALRSTHPCRQSSTADGHEWIEAVEGTFFGSRGSIRAFASTNTNVTGTGNSPRCYYSESYDPSLNRILSGITRDEAEACIQLARAAPVCAAQ
jgi:hypothetical protein